MEFPKKGDIIIADAEPHAGHEMEIGRAHV